MKRTTTLADVPTSARAARCFVAETLADWGVAGIVETAELLVSELVTNVLLHAHTAVELVASLTEGAVRIEVRDTSRVLPTTGSHHQESQTGRGLELVELLADSWGVDVRDGHRGIEGKGVWFELSVSSPPPPGRLVAGPPCSSRAAPPSAVCLQGVPTALYRASEEHRQDLTREFVVMTIDRTGADEVPARLVALSEEVARRFAGESAATLAQVQAAEQRGDATTDLLLELPAGAADPLAAIVDLLEEADWFCEQGGTLTVPATAEIRAFRRWWSQEVAAQLAGKPATPWSSR